MSSWIAITPRFRQGLDLVSNIDNGKLRPLVNRICQGLCSPVNDKVFTPDEEEKLLVSLNLQNDTLNLLIETLTSIYSQAGAAVIESSVMENTMRESFALPEDKLKILVNAWIVYAKKIVDSRQQTANHSQVEDINWSLNVETASSVIGLYSKPSVLLQLHLTGMKSNKLTVEMDRSNATELYNKLEKIQSQLDALK